MRPPNTHPTGASLAGILVAVALSIPSAIGSSVSVSLIGASKDDSASAIVHDHEGNVWMVGWTASKDFPEVGEPNGTLTAGVANDSQADKDAIVVAFSPNGSELLHSFRLGGSADDQATGVAMSKGSTLYITGWTKSMDFPITNGSLSSGFSNGSDAFLVALDLSTNSILFSLTFGGSSDDEATGVAIGPDGFPCVAGWTQAGSGPGFPATPGSWQSQMEGGVDAFLVKFTPDGSAITSSSIIGGALGSGQPRPDDRATAISIGFEGRIYVGGTTSATFFPDADSGVVSIGDRGVQAFILGFDSSGQRLLQSLVFGGSGEDILTALAAVPDGGLYATGYSRSGDFLTTPNVTRPRNNGIGSDAFLVALNASDFEMRFSTLLGGINEDRGQALSADQWGGVYVVGYTESHDFPVTEGAFDTFLNGPCIPKGCGDGFVVRIASQGSTVTYGSFIGAGDASDYALASSAADNFTLAVSGVTGAVQVPSNRSFGAPQTNLTAFLAVFTFDPPPELRPKPVVAPPVNAEVGVPTQLDASSTTDPAWPNETLKYRWDWESDGHWDSPWQESPFANHTFDTPGNHRVTVEVSNPDGFTSTTTMDVYVKESDPLEPPGTFPLAVVFAIAGITPAVLAMALRARRRRP